MAEQRCNPHDALFRGLLGDPVDAASEIRPVVAGQISAELAARIDWTQMELQNCSFVSPELRNRFSDLLFRTRIDGHPGYVYILGEHHPDVYVLAEHQSSSEWFMALRLLDYMVRIWWRHLDQYEADRKQVRERGGEVPPPAKAVPAIIPLVVHNTAAGRVWSAPVDFLDLIDLDPAALRDMEPFLPRFRYLLDDVSRLSLEALRDRDLTPAARAVLMLQKIVPGNEHVGRDILKWLVEELRALGAGPGAVRKLQMVITYILDVGDADEAELVEAFVHLGAREEEI